MPRAGLDRARVVQAAAELADEHGLPALTLATLAERLGVRSPSLYAHVGGLDDLRREVAAQAGDELAARLREAATGRAGREALRELALAYRSFAKRHPGGYAALQRATGEDLGSAQEIVAVLVAVLRGYGREGEEAIHAVRVIRSALHGFVLLETGDGFGLPADVDESFERLLEVLHRGLAVA
jgi:AcrR family transcriptional regulator